jgi:hypothetical protein
VGRRGNRELSVEEEASLQCSELSPGFLEQCLFHRPGIHMAERFFRRREWEVGGNHMYHMKTKAFSWKQALAQRKKTSHIQRHEDHYPT